MGKVATIVDVSKVDQGNQLKTRFKIRNNGRWSDRFKVYVSEILERPNFIEVPLVWLHGYAEGEKAATIKEIDSNSHAWVDFLTVYPDKGYYNKEGLFLALDLGAGGGVETLQLLDQGRTELVLRIAPRYGKSVSYAVTVEWEGKYSYPDLSYTPIRS